ncbi:nucleotidyltransferase substrate binding protein, HI0074 family [Anaerovirgula multivorans]|uniref:Nucleotidyltransferase substrate binding protein, HI0074 family n=1 Tax=Anaerovirgula multivorans TaxID=312168 RepID=A0A239L1F5_9FIRM|nr:nucleotidyltransferase substrate binding protein [Anaerovirgula multivorans]SNT24271.1 nucleotidyltransferase substrate binding protein, HI0074 family [Anaerovirgula multivorans]
MSKLETKLINFKNALDRLREAIVEFKQVDASDVVRDGLIQRFEFTYELSWKTTKEYLEDIGIVDKNSPKAVIKEAYAQKLIVNEKNWLLMLNDRNMTSHVYREEMAEEIADRIATCYIKEFQLLLEKLQN